MAKSNAIVTARSRLHARTSLLGQLVPRAVRASAQLRTGLYEALSPRKPTIGSSTAPDRLDEQRWLWLSRPSPRREVASAPCCVSLYVSHSDRSYYSIPRHGGAVIATWQTPLAPRRKSHSG